MRDFWCSKGADREGCEKAGTAQEGCGSKCNTKQTIGTHCTCSFVILILEANATSSESREVSETHWQSCSQENQDPEKGSCCPAQTKRQAELPSASSQNILGAHVK